MRHATGTGPSVPRKGKKKVLWVCRLLCSVPIQLERRCGRGEAEAAVKSGWELLSEMSHAIPNQAVAWTLRGHIMATFCCNASDKEPDRRTRLELL
ncbi:unnamed protein product [Protopolystoma xenopodis]|uniref:Uncharacterized protein n=1 Tax=Protopolystoma xenopodis TaxID=117903 RepID=A0A3S5AS34_9PLAT|nr:unnamed protein product [Protopolystoma xenopodis]